MTLRETDEVAALYVGARRILDADYGDGRRIGDSKTGGYLFHDHDGEPIYGERT